MSWQTRMRLAALVLALLGFASGAKSQSGPTNYTFVVGSGFLCDSSDSTICPAAAKAAQGDSYELSGAGAFDPETKSVKAAGTFAHKSASGHMLEMGVWIASQLVGFASYGIAPTALLHEQSPSGPPVPNPKRSMMFSGVVPTGGLAVLRIQLIPITGNPRAGELQLNCALGQVPNERSVEGIRLALDGGGNEFAEEAGGRVMFLSVRGMPTAPNTASNPRTNSDGVKEH